jgi:signal transduction histidine kinase/ActR/RegA family two-component response regulator
METQSARNTTVVPEFLSGGGEMGQRIREYDWASTPLGPVEKWPQSLRTCMRIMLTSRQPIWIGWGKELIKLYNDPYKAIVGGKHPWALGLPASVVWKDIWRDIDPMLRQVMEKDEGTYAESQLLIMERNGYPEETYYTFSYTPIPDDDGGTAGMICANTDDTDRIISERQLRTLTQLGKNLTDTKDIAEVVGKTVESLKDNPYDFSFALFYTISSNKAVFSHSTDLTGAVHSIPETIDLAGTEEIASLLNMVAATRQPQLMDHLPEKFGKMPKGAWETNPEKAVVLPIMPAASKDPFGFLIIGFNPYRLLNEQYSSFFSLIADQVATSFANVHVREEERKRAEALAEIDRAKTTFFSNISHEFRTPLTLLLGPIEEALSDPQTIDDNKIRLGLAYRNALRMQKLVNTLLDFSKIEAGRMEGKFTRVDIGSFTRDLASTFRSAIEKAGIKLQLNCEGINSDVYVDVDMWEKIVLNLVSNAFKYTSAGAIIVSISQAGDQVQLAVTDTGIGIPDDQLNKIFDRFHRIDNIHGRSQEGTGIGLAMVKELVKLQHGTLQVTSQPGKGSTFTVLIPAGREHLPDDKIGEGLAAVAVSIHSKAFVQEAMKWSPGENEGLKETVAPGEVAQQATGKSKVLLADDNADMREYVERLLADQFTIITANDGEEAFDKIIKHKPALLLSDIMMPKLDGFGLLKKVRNHPDTRNMPVIFLSARAGDEAKVEGLDAGADDYMTKPFSAKELIVRVSNHIRINQVRRETEQQFYQLFMQAPAIINVFKGPDFRYELYHPKNKELFGDRDFTGMTLMEALPELEGQGIYELLEEVYKKGITIEQFERHVALTNKSGKLVDRYFNLIYQPWYDLKGKTQGVLNFAIEVTETVKSRKKIEENEKNLEKLVVQRTQELQRSNDDLQQFAHVASHDLKEPVRKIRTFISRLRDEYEEALPEKSKTYLSKIQHASERMFLMIEGVLKYSTLNEAEQVIEHVDLNEIVNDIEADLELLITQKNATIKRAALPVLEGAPVLIYQLFYNLINNSLKFSTPENLPHILIASSLVNYQDSEYVQISITDNGIGFDQQYEKRIFNTFTRLNSKDKYEGTGLGLALCKKITERHHGQISATGEKNKGAIFTILLPSTQAERTI